MNLLTSATLVVVVAVQSCSVDNINGSDFTTANYPTVEECQAAAEVLDQDQTTRAFCINEVTNEN